ncbi:glycosyltransferase [Pseudalkalibacillus sp. Hm43]|uniref:glycosyltransferase n=1 Tax=Pseudalkalibacillus sp. Hm43 TaxID=3450742 RepID=UPI003F428891
MISVITCTNRSTFRFKIKENYSRQTWQEKELIIILNKNSLVKREWEEYFEDLTNVRIDQLDEKLTLGECLNYGIQLSRYPYISKMDDDDYYSGDYLTDSYETLQNSDARLIGKSSVYMYFEEDQSLHVYNPYKFAPSDLQCSEERYDPKVLMGGTLFFEKKLNDIVPFRRCSIGEDAKLCEDCMKHNIPIFSGKKDHYVYIRKAKDLHTWKMENEKMKKFCTLLTNTDDFISYLSKIS